MLIKVKANAINDKLLRQLKEANTRFVISYGGAGSGKSYAQTEHEVKKAVNGHEKILVVRKYATSLNNSVISLFKSVIKKYHLSEYFKENISQRTLSFINGSEIIFTGLDDSEKIKSIAGITRIWIEEATEITKDDFNQLNLRLRGRDNLQMTLTFNPTDEGHWIKGHFFDTPDIREQSTIIKTTYLDNKFIDDQYKQVLEGYANIDKNYHKIYALGEFGGQTEGRIFQAWEEIDEFPDMDGYVYGLDFGFSCFAEDTLITTSKGDVKIKDIKRGDYVLTTRGYRKVIVRFNNGLQTVVDKEVHVNQEIKRFLCTLNHNFNSNGKWKKYGELTTKDRLCVLLNTTERFIKDTQPESINTITTINGKKKGNIIVNYCITLFTKTILVKFQKVKSFITSTLTLSIITQIIYLLSLYLSIKRYTKAFLSLIKNSEKNSGRFMDIEKITGIKEEPSLLKHLKMKLEYVKDVKQNLNRQIHIKDIALQNVRIKHGCQITEIKNITKGREYVYDLWIEGMHEYFANGVLVHNCDPTAIVKVLKANERLYVDEMLYQVGMTNGDIAGAFKSWGYSGQLVICDSAEPKSIQELRLLGINAVGANKMAGSIIAGIDYLKRTKVIITKRSANLRKENQYYQWQQAKDGKFLNVPKDFLNHGIDAVRYSCSLNLPDLSQANKPLFRTY